MSEISSLAPSASASNVAGPKKRPGKRERAAARDNGSTSTANASKASAFGKASEPVFSPGKFPVVFDVGVGDPAVSAEMVLNVGGFINHSESVLDTLRSESRFNQFMAESSVLQPVAWTAFEAEFHAASLCSLATSVAKGHEELMLPVGDIGPIARSDAYHLDAIHSVVSQYGEFKVPIVGRRYVFPSYMETIRKIVYVADRIRRGVDREDAKREWWLPMSGTDPNFIFQVACLVEAVLLDRGEPAPSVKEIQALLFTGGQAPEWWELAVEHNPDLEPVTRLFERTLDTPADVVDLLGLAPDGRDARNILGLPWANPDPNDMNWQFNIKAAYGDIQARWALRRPYLDRSFVLATVPSRSGSYLGALTQLSHYSEIDEVVRLMMAYADEKHILSMAACFPPTAVFPAIERLDAQVVTIKNVREVRNVWILRDFK